MLIKRSLVAALIVAAITTLGGLVFFHNLNHSYQRHIEQITKQLEQQHAQQQQQLQRQLDKAKQVDQQLQQQVQQLQQQLSLKRAQAAAVAATQAAQAAARVQVASAVNCAAYEPLVAQYAWNVTVAMAIMHAESGCNPSATSPTCDHGLMQINCVHAAAVGGNLALLNDPATNIRVAYAIYTGSGWNAWTTFTSGAYLRYL